MTDEELRPLVLETIKTAKGIGQRNSVHDFLKRKFSEENLGPFGETEEVQMDRILWDLSVERIISWGTDRGSEARWPFFHVTPFGRKHLEEMAPHFLDPDGYLGYLGTLVPAVASIIL